jgi:hypothetical protein
VAILSGEAQEKNQILVLSKFLSFVAFKQQNSLSEKYQGLVLLILDDYYRGLETTQVFFSSTAGCYHK